MADVIDGAVSYPLGKCGNSHHDGTDSQRSKKLKHSATDPTHEAKQMQPLFADMEQHVSDEIVVPATAAGKSPMVYKVVRNQIPEDLKIALVQPFTDNELHEVYHHIDALIAETNHDVPRALWLFGPPAVGKTTLCDEKAVELFGRTGNAVHVDGCIFRDIHKGFQMVANHGLRNKLLHKDAWSTFKNSGMTEQLKEEVVEYAVKNRQHLMIPETALNKDRVIGMLDKLSAHGYENHACCLWAPLSETTVRGRSRSIKDGKAFCTATYAQATDNALVFAERWERKIAEGDPHYKSVQYYDNTVFPSAPVSHAEFHELSRMTPEESERHAHLCKAMKIAKEKVRIAESLAIATQQEINENIFSECQDEESLGIDGAASSPPSRRRVVSKSSSLLARRASLMRDSAQLRARYEIERKDSAEPFDQETARRQYHDSERHHHENEQMLWNYNRSPAERLLDKMHGFVLGVAVALAAIGFARALGQRRM